MSSNTAGRRTRLAARARPRSLAPVPAARASVFAGAHRRVACQPPGRGPRSFFLYTGLPVRARGSFPPFFVHGQELPRGLPGAARSRRRVACPSLAPRGCLAHVPLPRPWLVRPRCVSIYLAVGCPPSQKAPIPPFRPMEPRPRARLACVCGPLSSDTEWGRGLARAGCRAAAAPRAPLPQFCLSVI